MGAESGASSASRSGLGCRRATPPMRGSSPSWVRRCWSCWRRNRASASSTSAAATACSPLRLAELGCAVVGVDAAPGHGARGRGTRGVDARLADGAALPFAREFDAVFSNAALHWMSADPDAVIAGVARALRPGGRFVGEFGGHGNVAAIIVALAGGAGAPRHRRRRADPLVLPHAGRISSAPRAARLRRRPDRADPAPDPIADRHGGLARDLRRSVPAARYPTPSGPRLRAEAVELLRPVLLR